MSNLNISRIKYEKPLLKEKKHFTGKMCVIEAVIREDDGTLSISYLVDRQTQPHFATKMKMEM